MSERDDYADNDPPRRWLTEGLINLFGVGLLIATCVGLALLIVLTG